MPQVRTFVTAALLAAALAAGFAARLERASAQEAPPVRQDAEHLKLCCVITAVTGTADAVSAVTLASHPEDGDADAWSTWLAGTTIGKAVQLSESSVWHDTDDAGHLADSANGQATIELATPGTPQMFKAVVGQRVFLFYTAE